MAGWDEHPHGFGIMDYLVRAVGLQPPPHPYRTVPGPGEFGGGKGDMAPNGEQLLRKYARKRKLASQGKRVRSMSKDVKFGG